MKKESGKTVFLLLSLAAAQHHKDIFYVGVGRGGPALDHL
jgi:hypothetical protein